jgi:hypothetical protein
MNTTFEQRIDKFREKLFSSDLSSEIQKRMDQDYEFLLIYDDNEELIDLMNETIYEFSEIKNDWDEYLKIMKNPNIWDFFFNGHCGYYDEYDKCEDCQCIYMNPVMDYSYYKEGMLFEYEGEVKYLCRHCLQNYKKEYLQKLENNPKNWCNMFTVEECEQLGYKKVSTTFEHGLYGRTASPETILEEWIRLYPDDKFIFVRTDENPFACEFVLMKKIKNEEEE